MSVDLVVVVDVDGDLNVDLVATFDAKFATSGSHHPSGVRMLSFQRLDVYRRAIEFLALVYDVVDDLPKGHVERADQLLRAAECVVQGIALLQGVVAMLTKVL